MNLARLPPLGLKADKPTKNPAYMARVAQLPCVCCGAWPVSVHHCISGRFSQRKASDRNTIPLCWNHHQGPEGIHTSKEKWEATYGPDTDYLPVVADMLAGQFNSPWRQSMPTKARIAALRFFHDRCEVDAAEARETGPTILMIRRMLDDRQLQWEKRKGHVSGVYFLTDAGRQALHEATK